MSIHWSIKWSAFIASTVSLSWFFAGWRQVNASGQLGDWGLLFAGIAVTLLLVMVQGYWIYAEEKGKGRLTKRFGMYEKIYELSQSRKMGEQE